MDEIRDGYQKQTEKLPAAPRMQNKATDIKAAFAEVDKFSKDYKSYLWILYMFYVEGGHNVLSFV